MTKNFAYRMRCIDRVMSKHSGLDVMLGLAEIAYDIFFIGMNKEKKKLTAREKQQIIKELSKWERATSKT